ncbi:hypothetical protein [Herbidospora daliensis]|uniref:hypothetical protein n=1 Tax=Herbidospora daliensis TaxID=295585 RepID=UPI00078146D8|nr:hypothetical protein [Herbidospora daliensis]
MNGNRDDHSGGDGQPVSEEDEGHPVAAGRYASLEDQALWENRPARRQTYRSRAGIISRYVLVAIAAGLAVTFLWRDADADRLPVLVLKEDFPAYRMLTEGDVTLSTAASAGRDDYVSLPVSGRLTLKAVKKNQPLTRADLSPDVTKVVGTTPIVAGVSVPYPGGLNGALQPGDHVRLMLTGARAELDAFVLSVASGGAGKQVSLVVVLKQKDAERHAAALLEGRILVVKRAGG